MSIFVITFVFMLIVIIAMAVGVIFANKPIKGSCGGMNALGMDTACDICGGDTKKCEEEQERQQQLKDDLSYDASPKD